jgi:hypothetical protein
MRGVVNQFLTAIEPSRTRTGSISSGAISSGSIRKP